MVFYSSGVVSSGSKVVSKWFLAGVRMFVAFCGAWRVLFSTDVYSMVPFLRLPLGLKKVKPWKARSQAPLFESLETQEFQRFAACSGGEERVLVFFRFLRAGTCKPCRFDLFSSGPSLVCRTV